MNFFKNLYMFVSLVLAVHASEAIKDLERQVRGLKGSTPKKSKSSTYPPIASPVTKKSKSSTNALSTNAPKKSKSSNNDPKKSKGSNSAKKSKGCSNVSKKSKS
eukprot:13236471-Ditylum_brightwellii.AAC.1